MPKLQCICGDQVNLGDIPNKNEWLIVSDEDYDQFEGAVDAESLYVAMKSMIVCPSCSRLWVFWDGKDAEPRAYIPD